MCRVISYSDHLARFVPRTDFCDHFFGRLRSSREKPHRKPLFIKEKKKMHFHIRNA